MPQAKTALVTGSGKRRIGWHVAQALAERGYSLVVHYNTSRAEATETADSFRAKGADAIAVQADLTDERSVQRLVEQALSRFGRLDVLVNSALARDGHVGALESQTPETWEHAANGDFAGLFRHCQRAVAAMKQQGRGSIINIASIYGVVSNDPGLYEGTTMLQPPTYNFMKAGMINTTP